MSAGLGSDTCREAPSLVPLYQRAKAESTPRCTSHIQLCKLKAVSCKICVAAHKSLRSSPHLPPGSQRGWQEGSSPILFCPPAYPDPWHRGMSTAMAATKQLGRSCTECTETRVGRAELSWREAAGGWPMGASWWQRLPIATAHCCILHLWRLTGD